MLLELVGSAVKRIRRSRRPKAEYCQILPEDKHDVNPCVAGAAVENDAPQSNPIGINLSDWGPETRNDFLPGAHDFVIANPTMIEADKVEIINRITSDIDNGKPVFDCLFPYTTLETSMDSCARYPPPRCHPGTRRRIGLKLEKWLVDERRQWKMLWLHGPAGVGKSAVAQTFAEHCDEQGRLGAAFFFSKQNNWSNPNRVIPTLAYQLSVQCPEYRRLLANQLVNNPLIPNASMPVQFRKLIVNPFTELQTRNPPGIQKPYLILLDGLDECQGEDAQCEIIELIGEVVRRKDLPLLWLVCSRPEPHIKYTFSKTDFGIECSREQLAIDGEARGDVDQYLRDGFKDIQAKFSYTTNTFWPSEDQFSTISDAASGLFLVASTALKYIGDSAIANPAARLDAFLSFVGDSHGVGARSPLEALDILYTRILSDIPSEVLPITRRILSHHLYVPNLQSSFGWVYPLSAQSLCNFLCLDQSTFYSALRKLHSVIDVPPPELASATLLRFYHASFGDYLRDPIRSGRFALDGRKAFIDTAKSCLYWHEIDSTLYHTDDENSNRVLRRFHRHPPLPTLKWVSDDTIGPISECIADIAENLLWMVCANISDEKDQDLLAQIDQFDFRYIEYPYGDLELFANWLCRQTSSDSPSAVIRRQPSNEIDQTLINYLKLLVGNTTSVVPASFPVNWDTQSQSPPESTSWTGEYFLLGHGMKTCIICLTRRPKSWFQRLDLLNSDKPPSEAQISNYSEWIGAHQTV